MKLLAIYHAPQECGSPYVMLINLENGQPVKTIDIPEGYWDSGCEYAGYIELMDEEKVKSHSGYHLPELGETQSFENFKTGEYKRYVLTEITDVVESKRSNFKCTFYDAKLHYRRFREKKAFRYSSAEDTFKKEMEEQGINMKGWCVYKRRKTEFMEFLKAILPEVVNLIQIG